MMSRLETLAVAPVEVNFRPYYVSALVLDRQPAPLRFNSACEDRLQPGTTASK
jgi:hypothetical protein